MRNKVMKMKVDEEIIITIEQLRNLLKDIENWKMMRYNRILKENSKIRKENKELKEQMRYWDNEYMKQDKKLIEYRKKYVKWKKKTKEMRKSRNMKEIKLIKN